MVGPLRIRTKTDKLCPCPCPLVLSALPHCSQELTFFCLVDIMQALGYRMQQLLLRLLRLCYACHCSRGAGLCAGAWRQQAETSISSLSFIKFAI